MRKLVPVLIVLVVLVAIGAFVSAGARAEKANERGKTLAAARNHKEAVREFATAVQLSPDSAKYHYNLGITLAHLRLYDQASLEIREALRLQPDYPKASLALTAIAERVEMRQADAIADALPVNPDPGLLTEHGRGY